MCGKSCVDDIVEILLCKGRDVELGARTSKHIFVFAFDPLSLTLSLILYLASFILFIYTYMLGIACVYAILVLAQRPSTLVLMMINSCSYVY